MRPRNKKAFSLIELLVALGIIVMMLAGGGYIFGVAVKAQRTARATGEIMQKFRAVSGQLDADFGSMIKDAPILVKFEYYAVDENANNHFDRKTEEHRLDQIMFFADGEFSSLRKYFDTTNNDPDFANRDLRTIRGNIARIQYSLSRKNNPADSSYAQLRGADIEPYERFLTRRQHILNISPESSDQIASFPDPKDFYTTNNFGNSFASGLDNIYEHDNIPLAIWRSIPVQANSSGPDYEADVIPELFDKYVDIDPFGGSVDPITKKRDPIDKGIAVPGRRLHMLLSEGVSDFAIQFAYEETFKFGEKIVTKIKWYPCLDPDEDGSESDSQFSKLDLGGLPLSVGYEAGDNSEGCLGIILNVSGLKEGKDKFGKDTGTINSNMSNHWIYRDLDLTAIKFTFTLHDSNNVIEGGKTFSHIIYLNN